MIPRSFYSMALTLSLLTFLLGNYTSRTTPTRQNPANELGQLRALLRTVTDQIDLQDVDFETTTEENGAIAVTGKGFLFGIRDVGIYAVFGKELVEISTSYPSGAVNKIQIGEQKISDWLPDFTRNKLDVEEMKMQFYKKEKNRLVLTARLAPSSRNTLFEYNELKIQQPLLTFKLDRSGGTAPTTTATAELAGKFQLGVLNFDLTASANTKREWTFAGVLNELKVTDLVRSVGTHLGIANLPPMPSAIENFRITKASLALNSDRSMRFQGNCDLGKLEAYFAKPAGQPTDFLIGFAPTTSYKFARISNALAPIDKIGLTGVAMVYSITTEKIDQELQLLNSLQFGTQTVKAGITFMATFEIPDALPGLDKTKVVMRTNFPPSIAATPTLQAAVQFKPLPLGGNFRVNEMFLNLNPVDVSFGAGLSIGIKLDDNWIDFSGMGEVAAPATFSLTVFMQEGSVWKNPFGVKGVEIANLGLNMGANLATVIPTPVIGVSGALKVGPFQGEGTGILDSGNPLNSLISLKMNQIGMQQFIDAFTSGDVKREINKLPSQLRDFGIKDAELTIIPKTTEFAGRTYTQGLRAAGKVNIAGLGARMDVNASFDAGYSGVAAVSPLIIEEGNLIIFELTGNNSADSARMAIDMTYNNFLQLQNPFFLIDGKVGLLGMSNQTKVEINKDGVYFYNKGKIFDKFQAELDAKGGNFNDVKGFYVRAAMKNDLIEYLNNGATNAIDQATKDSQNRYRKAKEDIADAEAYLRSTQSDVDAFNSHKKKVENQEKEVEKLNDDAESAKKKCEKGDVIACGEYGAKKGAYEIAKGILKSYQETLSGLRDAVDWSKREIAANVVKASGVIVDEFDKASTATLKAAKWIVDKGLGGVMDVKSVEFAGRLDVLSGGNVTLKINAKFLKEDFNTQIAFNFNDPENAAKVLGDILVKELAPKGFAQTFGEQIKPRTYNNALFGKN